MRHNFRGIQDWRFYKTWTRTINVSRNGLSTQTSYESISKVQRKKRDEKWIHASGTKEAHQHFYSGNFDETILRSTFVTRIYFLVLFLIFWSLWNKLKKCLNWRLQIENRAIRDVMFNVWYDFIRLLSF